MRRGLFTLDFEPVVQAGDYVKLFPKDVFGDTMYEVVEPPVAYPVAAVIDLGAIDANTVQTSFTEVTGLELPANWMGQWRLKLIDDFKIYEMRYKGTAGSMAYALKGSSGFLTKESSKNNWLTEFFTWQDDDVYVRGENFHDFDIGRARILVSGYAFKLEIARGAVEKPYTRIYIGFERVE